MNLGFIFLKENTKNRSMELHTGSTVAWSTGAQHRRWISMIVAELFLVLIVVVDHAMDGDGVAPVTCGG
jgi:hypothetical protein